VEEEEARRRTDAARAAGALLRGLDEVARSRTGKKASVTEEEPDRSRAPP
jgi:hypothetical protein